MAGRPERGTKKIGGRRTLRLRREVGSQNATRAIERRRGIVARRAVRLRQQQPGPDHANNMLIGFANRPDVGARIATSLQKLSPTPVVLQCPVRQPSALWQSIRMRDPG